MEQVSVRAGEATDRFAEIAAATLLLGALTFGGGSRGAGDTVVHVLAVPALWLAAVRWPPAIIARTQRLFVAWVLAATAFVLLQLLPLPTGWLNRLPQRAAVLQDLTRAGVHRTWIPITLDFWGTVRSGLAFATFASMALLAMTLSPSARRRLLMLAVVAGVPMALLGFAQAAAGSQVDVSAPLRFYAYHHPIGAIGLFANRNHFADLLAMLLPFAIAFAAQAQGSARRAIAAAWSAVAVVLLLAAALSFSRAGIALAVFAVSASVLLIRPGQVHGQRLLPLFAVGVATLAIASYAWDGIATRLAQDPLDDLRWQYLQVGRAVLAAYWPMGSGFGTFRDVYAPFEPVARMVSVHALHAHDDLLELLVEGGVIGLLVLSGFLALLADSFSKIRKFRHAFAVNSRTIHIAAALACAVPILHSLVDYPLRTLSIAVVFGLAVSEVLSPETGWPIGHGNRPH